MTSQISLPKRADAVDALRGLAILGMNLSGVIPREGALPAWMYHAQTPPPSHIFNANLAGLTWVDLVFPVFLLTMGISVPLSLSRLIEKGKSQIQICLFILKRGFLLATFAIFLEHFRPNVIDKESGITKWYLGLLGLLTLFCIFVKLPRNFPSWLEKFISVFGWVLAIVLLSNIQYPNQTGFSLNRVDIILAVLTTVAVFGSLIWLFTQKNITLRLGIIAIIFALRFSSTMPGWVQDYWSETPIEKLFSFDYLKYLLIVIPGTIIGDLIFSWLKTENNQTQDNLENSPNLNLPVSNQYKCSTVRYLSISVLMLAINIILLVGLQTRQVWQTTIIVLILCLIGWLLIKQNNYSIDSTENLISKLYAWGTYWLILGLAFEPFQGGIKKDSATYSYFFVTAGMAIFLLIFLTIIIDLFQQKKLLSLFIYNGQNPMLGYVLMRNFLFPILMLTGLYPQIESITNTPILGILRGIIYTLIVAYIVTIFSRLKIFWRT
jgi:predicted acyltransferase